MSFADYTFYKNHGGKLSEACYNSIVDGACAEIIDQTNGKAKNPPAEMVDIVKTCECKLVDVMYDYAKATNFLPKGFTSFNNDGFSASTGVGNESLQKMESQEVRAVCVRYLQYPVNLMCKWL